MLPGLFFAHLIVSNAKFLTPSAQPKFLFHVFHCRDWTHFSILWVIWNCSFLEYVLCSRYWTRFSCSWINLKPKSTHTRCCVSAIGPSRFSTQTPY